MESDLNNILNESDVYGPDPSLCHSFFLDEASNDQ